MLCSILVFSVPSSLLPSPLSLFQSFATSDHGAEKNISIYFSQFNTNSTQKMYGASSGLECDRKELEKGN